MCLLLTPFARARALLNTCTQSPLPGLTRKRFVVGDRVGVSVNFDTRQISFACNGKIIRRFWGFKQTALSLCVCMSGVGSAVNVASYCSDQRYTPDVLGASYAFADALLCPMAAETPTERLSVYNHAGRAVISADGWCWGRAEYSILQAETVLTREKSTAGSYFEVEVLSDGMFLAGLKSVHNRGLASQEAVDATKTSTPTIAASSTDNDNEEKDGEAELDEKTSDQPSFIEVQNIFLTAVARQHAVIRAIEIGSAPPHTATENSLETPSAPSTAEESVRIPDWFQNDSLPVWSEIRMCDVIAVGSCRAALQFMPNRIVTAHIHFHRPQVV